MAYRVAVIQNESELMRYSYADARHLLSKADYEWLYFTSENIEALTSMLDQCDALIITTNSCNNPRILAWLERSQAKISSFLRDRNRGLLIMFQMALADMRGSARPYPFLSSNYKLRGNYRFASGEQAADGTFAVSNGSSRHPLLRFPNRIDVDILEGRSRTNNNAPGLYWGYYNEFAENTYDVVIEDPSFDTRRPLLLATRDAVGPRIVASSLVFDWQRQDDLWENAVRFVVEGLNEVAIVRRRGTSSFNMDLLEHALRERRVPFSVYSASVLSDWKDEDQLFPSVVFDPSWSRSEVANALKSNFEQDGQTSTHNFYFFDAITPAIQATSVIPRTSEYRSIVESAISWLISLWDGQQWEKSFWSSYDVIDLLSTVKLTVEPYKAGLISDIKSRLQPNGSYDDVFGATCAVLQMFSWLDYRHDDFDKALAWVCGTIASQNLYNAATAVEVLKRVSPHSLDDGTTRRIVDQIVQAVPHWEEGLETLRYMKTLLAVGNHEIAKGQIARLLPAASGKQEWLTVFGAAETVSILLQIYTTDQGRGDDIERLLFKGIEYLLDQYDRDSGTWRNNVVATAKAAKAVAEFDSKASPAIVDAIRSITSHRGQTAATRATDSLLARNRTLTEDLVEMRTARVSNQAKLGKLQQTTRKLQNWSIATIVAIYAMVILVGLLSLSVFSVLDNALKWAADWQEASVPLALCLLLLPLLMVTVALTQFGRDPTWLRFARKHLRFLNSVVGPDNRQGDRSDA
ncbi:hypothetical protein AB0C01_01785 [Micromonospora sp. NPDC048905]|uniref:hypothetical protein n=1 Tax=Micromonospora sp. NPDC048905 TaxID=3155494 RepID=UPI0034069E2E